MEESTEESKCKLIYNLYLNKISFSKTILLRWLFPGSSLGFPGGSVVKNPPANAGDTDLIPGLGRSPGEENSNPLQYSCLGNPMDRGAWTVTVHGQKSRT